MLLKDNEKEKSMEIAEMVEELPNEAKAMIYGYVSALVDAKKVNPEVEQVSGN